MGRKSDFVFVLFHLEAILTNDAVSKRFFKTFASLRFKWNLNVLVRKQGGLRKIISAVTEWFLSNNYNKQLFGFSIKSKYVIYYGSRVLSRISVIF